VRPATAPLPPPALDPANPCGWDAWAVEMVQGMTPLLGKDPCALADTLGVVPCWQVALHLDLVLGQQHPAPMEQEQQQEEEEEEEEGTVAAAVAGGGGGRRKGHRRVSRWLVWQHIRGWEASLRALPSARFCLMLRSECIPRVSP
jgi:hypothetical protein